MSRGVQTDIYSSIRYIARITPDLNLEEREDLCRAIITLCELGEMLQGTEMNKTES
ncbi:hypothetical protein WL1483_782 [Aeromonas schubertii]|uniref:Uncharacterized protein n=1 Tax=Aeromonas schubertii TaxID=652 RepID=A0A0S2SER3_9GAMM|nr:hypothetical protein WL1483_782 [Aeromonas schubertii]